MVFTTVESQIIFTVECLSTPLQIPQATNRPLSQTRFDGNMFVSIAKHVCASCHKPRSAALTPSHSANADGTLHRGTAAPTLIVASGHPVSPTESLILAGTESLTLAGTESPKRVDTESLILSRMLSTCNSIPNTTTALWAQYNTHWGF